jgi:hypothetical protein
MPSPSSGQSSRLAGHLKSQDVSGPARKTAAFPETGKNTLRKVEKHPGWTYIIQEISEFQISGRGCAKCAQIEPPARSLRSTGAL